MAHWLCNSRLQSLLLLLLLLRVGSLQARTKVLDIDDVDGSQLETKGYQSQSTAIQPRVDDNSAGNYRLPNNTVPLAYDVELWTEVDQRVLNFTGRVKININVVDTSNTITLHFRQTANFSASIINTDVATSTESALTVTTETTREFLTLTSTTSLTAGSNYTLTINYTGLLRTDQGGFYYSSYTDDDGTVHPLATTQFESTNARHAFPCYDEPAKRANFTITIHHNATFTAISNMPVNEAASSAGITVFQTTPKMSTYLIAFIVSDFECTSGELNGLPQRVFSRKGRQNEQEWALLSGLVVENSLAGYFGVPFPLPKLDQAGIPDFSAGAMENWGLATYREMYMWWTKEGSTINLKTSISNIIGHEYAHMWFGDLVSVQWWTYLWLKEGFATLFSYESNDIAFPEWNTYQIFQVSDYNSALINDAATSAVPMTHYVQTPSEISNRYNTFSYAKPACVLFMFKNAWTDAVFRRGLNHYLTTNQYTSADEWYLFASLQTAADELNHRLPVAVATIFSSWSQKAGYPLLTVTRDYSSGTFSVSQQRFLNNRTTVNSDTWYVPINYAVSSAWDYRNTTASHYLLNVANTSITGVNIASDEWLLLNKQSSGYYRILYDEENYRLIAKGLAEETYKFHPRNRAQLLHDAYRFVDTGRISQATLFQLLAYLKNEDQYAPWSTANSILTIYDQYLRGDSNYAHFKEFVVELIEDIFLKLSVNEQPGEHYLNNYLRVTLISLACQVGSEKCYTHSAQKLKDYLERGVALEPTVRTQAYCAGLRQTDDTTYNLVRSHLFASTSSTDRSLFISSLGCSQSASQLKTFVESSIDTSNSLSYSERTSLLNAAYSRSQAGVIAGLDFLEVNWRAYAALSTTTAKPLDSALRGIANYVVSDAERTRLNALVQEVNTNGADYVNSDLSTTVTSNIQSNFDWLDTHRDPVINWLSAYRAGSGSSALGASLLTLLAALALLLCNVH